MNELTNAETEALRAAFKGRYRLYSGGRGWGKTRSATERLVEDLKSEFQEKGPSLFEHWTREVPDVALQAALRMAIKNSNNPAMIEAFEEADLTGGVMTMDGAAEQAKRLMAEGFPVRLRERSFNKERNTNYWAIEVQPKEGENYQKLYGAEAVTNFLLAHGKPTEVKGFWNTYYGGWDFPVGGAGSGGYIQPPNSISRRTTWQVQEIRGVRGLTTHNGRRYKLVVDNPFNYE